MKTETKHTPGPWRVFVPTTETVVYEGGACPATIVAGGVHIATMPGTRPYFSETGKANALLIAAAPGLLEALERLADIAEGDGMDFSRDIEDVRIVAVRGVFMTLAASARAALAKARGEKGGGL